METGDVAKDIEGERLYQERARKAFPILVRQVLANQPIFLLRLSILRDKTVTTKRVTSKKELDEIIDYWINLPRGSGYHVEDSLITFLETFTPKQIKGAMYIAKSKSRLNYFKYLCAVLHNWKKDLEEGKPPQYFDISE